jgi:protein-S-isoprenylcysteine O-methyltransferase Ste14
MRQVGTATMSLELKMPVFDEPTSADASAPPKRFKFAPTFVIDIVVSLVFVAAVLPLWAAEIKVYRGLLMAPTLVIGVLILACYIGKILVVLHLDQRGGDARAYVKSSALVTTGPYGWSRHPTYLLAMVQFVLWALLALYLQAFALTWHWLLLAAAFGLPTAFFLVNELIVMPSEEAMLARLHPEEFARYALRVRRWFGRKSA